MGLALVSAASTVSGGFEPDFAISLATAREIEVMRQKQMSRHTNPSPKSRRVRAKPSRDCQPNRGQQQHLLRIKFRKLNPATRCSRQPTKSLASHYQLISK